MNNPLLAIDSLINFSLINKLAFLTFIVTTMLGAGLSLTVKEIIEPLRNIRLVIFSLVANFILVPFFVYLLLQIMPLSESVKIGFTILAVAAALLVGGSNFDDPNVISVIVVTSLSMIVMILLAKPKFGELKQLEVS